MIFERPDLIWTGIAGLIIVAAFCLGPSYLAIRSLLRGLSGGTTMRRFYRPVTFGFLAGAVAAAGLASTTGQVAALWVSLLVVLFLLAVIDWAWRWLPVEWTLLVIAIAVLKALGTGKFGEALLSACLIVAILLIIRQALLWLRGIEALGLGDVWLMAGLAGMLSPTMAFFLMGGAALTGLVEVLLRRIADRTASSDGSVSYGTHLCGVFVAINLFLPVT
ncbi:prepilin peptidase [Litoreibacter roseus]|uniref:Prepilin type IV endopeptidase peptidase domain-containing protein n=1 Tax=Litoreibacter roseus TaxID=2601869 RepID=A0A6N6JJN3_9RHOB|nr:prepilin peptidase [Litoreibacter roseus]GFE66496.1 hypothetical protein KIN_35700 [Litoreibacter roseus]